MSRTDGFAIAQHTCIEANLRSGRSCDKQLIRAASALCIVMSPTVSAWLSLASSSAISGRSRSCMVWRPWSHDSLVPIRGVSLVCLDCDAVAIPVGDAVQYSPTLLEVWVSPEHLLLDCVLSGYHLDEEFKRQPFSTNCDVVSMHRCNNVLSLDVTFPHTRARASHQFQIAECRCHLLLPVLCDVARATGCIAVARTCVHRLAGSPRVVVQRIRFFVLDRRSTPSARQLVLLIVVLVHPWRPPTAQPSAPPAAASTRTALASRASCIPSRPISPARWAALVVPCPSPPILS